MLFILGQGAYYVDPPLCKWSWGGYDCHLLSRDSMDVSILLIFVTPFDEVLRFLLHCWPKVPRSSNLGYQRSRSHVISANAFVDFF